MVFQEWMMAQGKTQINPLEQLAYVGSRGMGALTYVPAKELSKNSSVDLEEIVAVVQKVMDLKSKTIEKGLTDEALFNIFRIGTSAGGARPKILVSEHKKTGKLISGDLEYSDEYSHYIIKLAIDEQFYEREKIEFVYYQMARALGIEMMPSKLIANKHFATLRFDRQNGEKKHILTATGITGWDFRKPKESRYENIFKLALDLNLSHKRIRQLFKRMVFNVIFANTDDHLKNVSFIFDEQSNQWDLAPAYDLTFAANPLLRYTRISRASSINGKRTDIERSDILKIADLFSIKDPQSIIDDMREGKEIFRITTEKLAIPERIRNGIRQRFVELV